MYFKSVSIQVLNRIPDEITLGDKVQWTEDYPDCPASTWTLTYYFIKADGTAQIFNVAAVAYDGTDSFLVTILAADVAAITAGDFRFKARLAKDGVTTTAAEGPISFLPDYSTAIDTRSTARKIVEAIDAAIAGTASMTQKKTKIRDREIEFYTSDELTKLRNYYQGIVEGEDAQDNIALGRRNKTTIRARFT